MGDLNSGGGGSVHWHVRVKNPKPGVPPDSNDGMTHYFGADEGGNIGERFSVSIKLPHGLNLDTFKAELDVTGNRVVFTLPIEDDKDQIHIHWPNKGGTT
jgi:hypothetical protein